MSSLVYIARLDSDLLQSILRKLGYEYAVHDGAYDEELLEKATVLVPGKLPVNEALLEKAPHLRLISKYGIGLDRIDIDACTRHRVLVCNAPSVNPQSVAEHALALILALAKQIPYHDRHMQGNPPQWRKAKGPRGLELRGKTLTIIGLGRIGQLTAELAHAIGMHIVGYDPYANTDRLPDYIVAVPTLKEAMQTGDVVSIHVAGREETRGLISAETLSWMKPTALLINTTRGFVIDENALAQALDNGVIAGAAVDVIAEEPVTETNPLLHRENVLITPHCAANTHEAHLRTEEAMAENIRLYMTGNHIATAVNGPF